MVFEAHQYALQHDTFDLARGPRRASRGRPAMMTAKQYRTRAILMDQAREASSNALVVLECQRMATQWRRLADLADWQNAMLEKGHPAS